MNKFIKDRKTLSLVLCLVLVCVFTLTVAYSALSAVLTIQGNARVSAADWDIYLNNPRVTNGSATTNVPVIKTSSTLEFETTLNMPGDFYEFVVDVVNAGDIDAMIENVVKTPELTTEQAKFLKYEVSYQNGESITTKQLLAKDTTMPIKVRVEYRNDISASDLPITATTLDLALTLEYIQSDGTGTSVNNNGVYDPFKIGNELCIGEECFYVISSSDTTITMMTKYNLYVGGDYNTSLISYGDEATGMQDSTMNGYVSSGKPWRGITPFSNSTQDYVGSIVEGYVNDYKTLLETNFGVDVLEARLITYDELTNTDTFACKQYTTNCSDLYPWIYSTSYWTGSAYSNSTQSVYTMTSNGYFNTTEYNHKSQFGVRPVIIISKDYFN